VIDSFVEEGLEIAVAGLFHSLLEIAGVDEAAGVGGSIHGDAAPESFVAELGSEASEEQRAFDIGNLA
jgi:hypothetical protein